MEKEVWFSPEENALIRSYYRRLRLACGDSISGEDILKIKNAIIKSHEIGCYDDCEGGAHPLLHALLTAVIASEEIGLKGAAVESILLQHALGHVYSLEFLEETFGQDVSLIIRGLVRTRELYKKNASIETENFRKLLMSFAEDIRVILIMIADRVALMRELNSEPDSERKQKVAREASYLYAPMAHRLGLYKLKTELEDISLKYLNRQIYSEIARKLNETKRSRDAYIEAFIAPIQQKLDAQGNLKFYIKGRTKSIHSIWNKLHKQNISMEGIYDLFAIRIILDSEPAKEKSECWQAYSIITDMYQPNPKRLRDWLSIPKSNGYESLHTTVMGPGGKWVEVQIRTKRMDEVAEKGLAAHWKYKGGKQEENLDEWLKGVREMLEQPEAKSNELIHDFKMDLYDEEIFVFTPKGELHKMRKGATVLDFAFNIHSGLGSKCVGARINGRNVPIKYVLSSGDQIEILTSPNQKPKQDWLNIVVTSKAKTKIKQSLKEHLNKEADYGRELLLRRMKNRKIDFDDASQTRLFKKMGYKSATDFYADISLDKIEVNHVIDLFLELQRKEEHLDNQESVSAENFVQQTAERVSKEGKDDVLVIDEHLQDLDFKLAKCCNPIYGDEVFGFVSSQGGIRIHRKSCSNAPNMISRFGYRIVSATWAGKSNTQYPITLHVVGNDNIGIVTNVTSIISKEKNVSLRSININSHAGLFQGAITIFIDDVGKLNTLMDKITNIKGVKHVTREGGVDEYQMAKLSVVDVKAKKKK